MKKRLFVCLAGLMVLAACSNNDELLKNEHLDGPMTVTATLPGDTPDSRVVLTEDNTDTEAPAIKVAWEDEEHFSVIRGSENVTYSKTTEGNTFTGNAHTATEGTYYGFYPTTTVTTTTAIPYDLSVQTGTLDKTNTYMYAVNDTDGKNYEFKHLTALVKFTLTLPNGAETVTPTKVVISSDKLLAKSTVDLTGADVVYSTEANTATSITVTPTALTFYTYVNPMVASSDAKNTFIISMDGSDGNYYSGTLETSVSIRSNYLYAASVNMIKVEKGDYAMKDGSFIKYEAENSLTDAQKANIAGIVFWTTSDSNISGTTPAKLTDDAIMAADFPNCTHGLIVSLKDVSTSCAWQSTYTNIASWQTSAFTADNKDKYKSIASDADADDNVNYILGYQNTKLLKAYNKQCEEANRVLPVSSLDEFSTSYPAPAKSTGWFIPSVKELILLCDIDLDNVWGGKIGSTTKEKINGILNDLGTDYAASIAEGYYWSSTEYATNFYYAFDVSFIDTALHLHYKSNADYVRAVCAY